MHALRGRFVHEDITKASPVQYESALGRATHYLVGGSLALSYPALYAISGAPVPGDHVLPGIAWGLATTLLPWIVFYPAFGWGWFGTTAPRGTRPLLSPTVTHLVYGLGLGLVLNIAWR